MRDKKEREWVFVFKYLNNEQERQTEEGKERKAVTQNEGEGLNRKKKNGKDGKEREKDSN